MAPRDTYGYSSSSSNSRSSSSSSAELARQLGGLSINSKKASSYDPKYSSREPERKHSSKYDTTLITPDTSRSRGKQDYGRPVVRDERKRCTEEPRRKTEDSRYHVKSFLDGGAKDHSSSRREKEDARFYQNSSYYRSGDSR